MAILSSLFEKRLEPSRTGLGALLGIGNTAATGINVTVEGSLTYSAVYACVRVIAEGCASLPLITYERLANGGKRRAENHYLYDMLKDAPNPEMTAFEYRELVKVHLCLWGNAYSEIEYLNGVPVALWPLRPDRMYVTRGDDGQLWYQYARAWGETEREIDWVWLPAWRIHHVRGLGGDGIMGYSPVRIHMEAIGLGLGTQQYGARFFGNGARPGVVLKHPGTLSPQAHSRLRESWSNQHQGIDNAHKVKILEEGMGLETVGIPPEEAQFLQTRKFQINEIARIFRVPPHMIADLDNATFSNIEHQDIGFVKHTLRPWLIRYEQSVAHKLLTPTARRKIFVEHTIDALLRGATKERYEAHALAVINGWTSRNEVRIMENMNPVPGLDDYLVQLNMAEVGASNERAALPAVATRGAPAPSKRADDSEELADVQKVRVARQKLARSLLPVFKDSAARVVRREVNDIRRAVDKYLGRRTSATEFRNWLTDFYREFNAIWVDAFLPLLLSYAAQVMGQTADELDIDDPGVSDDLREFIDGYLQAFGNEMAATGRRQIEAILDDSTGDEEASQRINERLDGWESSKASKTALRQVFEAGNAIAIAGYAVAGVVRLRWAASGDSCPFCQHLNGKIIGINEYFVTDGDTIDGGESGNMNIGRNVRSGSLHEGCDCTVIAA